MDQVERIIAVIGTPDINKLSYKIDEKTTKYLEQLPKREKIDWKLLFPNSNHLALDLLDKMLNYDPENRLDALQCIQHPYFQKYTTNKDFKLENCSSSFDWSFDNIQLSTKAIQLAITEEINSMKDKKQNEASTQIIANIDKQKEPQKQIVHTSPFKKYTIQQKEEMRDRQRDIIDDKHPDNKQRLVQVAQNQFYSKQLVEQSQKLQDQTNNDEQNSGSQIQ